MRAVGSPEQRAEHCGANSTVASNTICCHLSCAQYGDLVRISKLPQPQLRAGLLVLIQHNYVNVYLKQVGWGGFCAAALGCDNSGAWHMLCEQS